MPHAATVVEPGSTTYDETELARQIVAGDRDALERWFCRFQPPVYSFVYYRVGNDAELAADATQSTFLAALERLGDFDVQRGDMTNWLRFLSRNIVRDLLREHRRGAQLQAVWDGIDEQLRQSLLGIDEATLPTAALERSETRQLVGMALANLPLPHREVLEAKYMRGQSLQQIADTRGSTVDGVKSMLRRARHTFRDCFLAIAKAEINDV